jgi:transposase InsO family protein
VLIVRMVKENPTWGEERIAAELLLKLNIEVSPRTVRAYWPSGCDPRNGKKTSSQHWRTFIRIHARSIAACDFLVSITASFRVLYVLVIMEIGSRRILHCNVTAHPTAEWALQQFREAMPGKDEYKFLIHDRDSIFSAEIDKEVETFGIKVLRAPRANAYCERLIGSIRRECLDWVIPLSERDLRRILREWVAHYNPGRPHASLGPGIPEAATAPRPSPKCQRHELPPDCRIGIQHVLGGLHHEYRLKKVAA